MLFKWIGAFRGATRRFASSRDANVATIFALACIPLIAAVGIAVDYARVSRAHSHMQDALDATTLALSRQADIATMSPGEMQKFATDYFQANFPETDMTDLAVTPSYSASGPSVTVTASGTMPLDFGGIIGRPNVPLSVKSTTVWGQSRLRVALVLDNTLSMADDGKIDALKTASHNLLTQLQNAAASNGDVYVSIIPFVKDVNVGPSNYAQSWVRWDLWDEDNGKCSNFRFSTKSQCIANGKYTWTPANHDTWNGCVTDRDQNYDTMNTAPDAATPATLFPAEQYSSCPQALMGLSYDWTALNDLIDGMRPAGFTNQAIGLQWGWQSLTNAPFVIPPSDSTYRYKQIIILLTDGLNTQDRWYGNKFGKGAVPQIDARQEILCGNIKTAGITIYTVQVNTGNDPTSTLLQNCATDASHFFLLTSADQIITTFKEIGTQISDLRLSS